MPLCDKFGGNRMGLVCFWGIFFWGEADDADNADWHGFLFLFWNTKMQRHEVAKFYFEK